MNYNSINKSKIQFVIEQYSQCNNIGLFTGKAGIVLLSLLISAKDKSSIDTQLGEIHLEYIHEHAYEIPNISFSEGLIGVGWILELVTQCNYGKNNYDMLLEEIDDIVYKLVTFHHQIPFSMDNGYIGCLFYFYYRLKAVRRQMNFYKEVALKECSALIMIKLYNEIKKEKLARLTSLDLWQCHILAHKFQQLLIQDDITSKILSLTRKDILQNKNIEIKQSSLLSETLHNQLAQTQGFRSLSLFI